MPRLSLIVIARNEEASIGRCLRSGSFADETVVVVNQSTDKTAEIARCVVFLAADESSFITGSTLSANGGQYFL